MTELNCERVKHSGVVAWMERSEIQDCRRRAGFPGLRFAPSGLRGFAL